MTSRKEFVATALPLRELGTFRNGVNFSKDSRGNKVNLINVKDIFGDRPRLNFPSLDQVEIGDIRDLTRYQVEPNDLFFVRSSVKRDGIGLVRLADSSSKGAVHCGFVIRFRLTSKLVHPAFLTYLLRSPEYREQIKNLSGGAAITNISQDSLGQLQVLLPKVETQRRIASILSAYDDLIENNTRRIAILEEMARRIYEEWFVRFRYPGHEKVRMVESELGLVPEGWKTGTLSDLIDNVRHATRPGEHLSSRRYVPIDCISKRSLVLPETRSIAEAQSSLVLFERNDILFGAMRPYFHKVAIAPCAGVTRTTCFVLRPKHTRLFAFAAMTMFADSVVAYASAHTQGATIPYAVWDGSLANYKIAIPPDWLLERFEEAVSPMLVWLRQAMFKQDNLRTTRDLLLPKLISGELDVSHLPEPEAMAA